MVAKRFAMVLALLGAAHLSAAPAAEPQTALQTQAPANGHDSRAEVAAHLPGTRPEQLQPSPISGIYELTRGAEIAYVTTDGKYAITGDLYDLKANDNLTESHRREVRTRLLSAVPETQMVIFTPKDPKYTITVFTDVDCGYCRKLHSEISEYNRLGIRVRYLAYPRTGPNTESWTKAEQVWCSTDRNDALTRAKLGQPLQNKACPNNPVARTYQLGRDFALDGTPAIILPDGELLPGYVPPDVLAEHLKDGKPFR